MLAFISQPKTMLKHYEKNACIRNIPVLKKLTVEIGDLSEVQFRIEVCQIIWMAIKDSTLLKNTNQYRFDAPVAQLTAQAPIVHVSSSSAIDAQSIVKGRVLQSSSTAIILSASFQHNDGGVFDWDLLEKCSYRSTF